MKTDRRGFLRSLAIGIAALPFLKGLSAKAKTSGNHVSAPLGSYEIKGDFEAVGRCYLPGVSGNYATMRFPEEKDWRWLYGESRWPTGKWYRATRTNDGQCRSYESDDGGSTWREVPAGSTFTFEWSNWDTFRIK